MDIKVLFCKVSFLHLPTSISHVRNARDTSSFIIYISVAMLYSLYNKDSICLYNNKL